MERKYNKVFKLVSITDYKSLEKYLEDMAAKGWMLTGFKRSRFIFEKTEPVKLDFTVSLFYHTSAFEYYEPEKEKDYKTLCEESGWTYCASNNIYQVFYKEKETKAMPIHTDSSEEYKIIKETFFKTDFWFIPLGLMYLVIGIVNIINFSYEDLLSNGNIFNLIWPLLTVILFIIILIYPVIFLIKNKANIDKGKDLEFLSDTGIKKKSILIWGLIIFYSLLLILFYIDIAVTAFPVLFIVIPLFLPAIAAILCIRLFKKKKNDVSTNILIYILVGVLATMISIFGVMKFMTSDFIEGSMGLDKNDNAPEMINVLEVIDFGMIEVPERTRLRKTWSIFAPQNVEYYESLGRRTTENEVGNIETTYIRCINEGFANYIFDSYVNEELERYIKYRGEDYEGADSFIFEVDNDVWPVDRVYYLWETKQKIILKKGTIIYILDGDVDFSEPEVIDKCIEKLEL